ncbi:amidohydrolase [bacterium]|nr:MAG: amidohydrolase [bacterium]
MQCIDVHAHLIPGSVVERLLKDGAARTNDAGNMIYLPPSVSGVREAMVTPFTPALRDIDVRLAANDKNGIDRQIISVPPFYFGYRQSPEAGGAYARAANDDLAKAVAAHPDRFYAFATAPLQDPAGASRELERCIGELGFVGVEIGSNIAGTELDDPSLEPFWATCVRLNALIFIHPHHVVGGDRLGAYYLSNFFGNPSDTALGAARLIFGGVLERHDLKIVLAHAGGALPQLIGRWDHGWSVRPEAKSLPKPPSTYFKRLYFDTIAHDDVILTDLIHRVGAEHVIAGTDAPYDMGIPDPRALLARLPIDEREREAILGGNVAPLLHLTAAR